VASRSFCIRLIGVKVSPCLRVKRL
jgi:hypothetical protein